MYGYSSIRTPSQSPGNGSYCFQDPLNQRLNHRYRILKHLSQGGFSQTFLAVDEQQNSLPCVMKQVFLQRDAIYYQTTPERFHQEVERLAELGNHSQIPALFDTFEQDNCAFIVQEWIDGWTLEQEAEGIPFDEAEVWQVLREVLPILQYLHDRQIIHRDIKPANIIRRKSDRQLVLVDFGAAKQITHLNSFQTGTMIGSVEYAAPEQIKGQAVFASDLYSLGVTCLYLLTQVRPFDLYDIVEDDWKWQAYLPQPISPALKVILCKLLQPAVRRRYQSVTEVLTDLNSLSVLTIDRQADKAIANPSSSTNPLSFEVNNSLTPKSIDKAPFVSGATIYLPPTEDWYYLPREENISDSETQTAFFKSPRVRTLPQMTNFTSETSTNLVKKLRVYGSTLLNKDAVGLVFTLMLSFMATCISLMLMICFFLEMEKRSLLQTEAQQPSSLPALDVPAQSKRSGVLNDVAP